MKEESNMEFNLEVIQCLLTCACLYCRGMRMMTTGIGKADVDAATEDRWSVVRTCECLACVKIRERCLEEGKSLEGLDLP